MELGNIIFGNSRGAYEVDRSKWQDIFNRFFEVTGIDAHGNDYETEKFTIFHYYWGEDEVKKSFPNFIVPEIELEISWYKYPMRDSYSNKILTDELVDNAFKIIYEEFTKKKYDDKIHNFIFNNISLTDNSIENINIQKEICEKYGLSDIGELSDGYHTFNSLYYQRMVLFATLVNIFKNKSWKSKKHSDGELCFGGGWFVVCIETPDGPYSYHYELKYWDYFMCDEIECGKEWDGHTDKDVERLLSLTSADEIMKLFKRSYEFIKRSNDWKDATYYTPRQFNLDWVLVKTDVLGKDSIPHVAELRADGKWYTQEDKCLNDYCKVTHWKQIPDEFLLKGDDSSGKE